MGCGCPPAASSHPCSTGFSPESTSTFRKSLRRAAGLSQGRAVAVLFPFERVWKMGIKKKSSEVILIFCLVWIYVCFLHCKVCPNSGSQALCGLSRPAAVSLVFKIELFFLLKKHFSDYSLAQWSEDYFLLIKQSKSLAKSVSRSFCFDESYLLTCSCH